MSPGLVYHAGGLGDFVLSLPAVFRAVSGLPAERWHYWGPADRLCLLPGFLPAPAELLRAGHTLWGDSPDPTAQGLLLRCSPVLAFGGARSSHPVLRVATGAAYPVASFPGPDGPRVPVHHAAQLAALGVPRTPAPWLPAWRAAVCPDRRPERILLHPGSGDRRKNLPLAAWRGVLAELGGGTRAPVRLVVGPTEQERGGWKELEGIADEVSVCGSLPELLKALSRARLFLGNDSGPAHLASLLGIPTVAVFGASNARLWRPLGPNVGVVRARTPCAPCTHGGPFPCSEPQCLDDISPAEIIREALRVLRRDPPAQGAAHPNFALSSSLSE